MAFNKLTSFFLSAALAAAPTLALAQEPPSEPAASEESNDRQESRERRRARPAPTPAQTLETAKGLLTAAGANCQATAATQLGVTVTAQEPTYEVTCTNAPGVLVIASTPPKVVSCLELAGQAFTTRELDPAAEVGQQCTVPQNMDPLPFVTTWAQDAGIPCAVDQASAIGKTPEGGLIYEVGCRDADGYWLSEAAQGWTVKPCWDLTLDNQKCRFTTADETKLGWKAVLASSEAAACDVTEARRAGRDGQGLTVYEVKCSEGDGHFVRIGSDWKVQRTSACAASAHIGGGCRLTPAPAAAPAPAPQAQE